MRKIFVFCVWVVVMFTTILFEEGLTQPDIKQQITNVKPAEVVKQTEVVNADDFIYLPEETEFLKKFDQLFFEDISGQSDEIKENIRRIIVIHARDLLRQTEKTPSEHGEILVERRILQHDWISPRGIHRYSNSITEDRASNLPEEKQKLLLYSWSIALDCRFDSNSYYAPSYVGLVGVRDHQVISLKFSLSHSACGGVFNNCCDQGRLPLYYQDMDTVKQLYQYVDGIPTLENLFITGIVVDGNPSCEGWLEGNSIILHDNKKILSRGFRPTEKEFEISFGDIALEIARESVSAKK
ncbi:MAG: hypothetical protein ACRC2T_01915 [Thermoguttaceae bacterium]